MVPYSSQQTYCQPEHMQEQVMVMQGNLPVSTTEHDFLYCGYQIARLLRQYPPVNNKAAVKSHGMK